MITMTNPDTPEDFKQGLLGMNVRAAGATSELMKAQLARVFSWPMAAMHMIRCCSRRRRSTALVWPTVRRLKFEDNDLVTVD
jgi:hypothetical protein